MDNQKCETKKDQWKAPGLVIIDSELTEGGMCGSDEVAGMCLFS